MMKNKWVKLKFIVHHSLFIIPFPIFAFYFSQRRSKKLRTANKQTADFVKDEY